MTLTLEANDRFSVIFLVVSFGSHVASVAVEVKMVPPMKYPVLI